MDQERETTGAELKRLANDACYSSVAVPLNSLAQAVEDGGDREAVWRGVNLFDVFRPETSVKIIKNYGGGQTFQGVLGSIAAVVVFFPVLWTWFSFRSAANAYADMVQSGEGDGQSFLQLWATGFDGALQKYQRLTEVATWSVFFIAVSVALVFVERLVARSAVRKSEQRWQRDAATLTECLTYAQVTINRGNVAEPLQDAADLLVEAAERVLTAQTEIRETISALQDAAQEVRTSMEAVIASLLNSVANTAKTLDNSVTTTADTLDNSVQKVTGTLVSSVTTAMSKFDGTVGSIVAAAGTMQTASDESAKATTELAGGVKSLGDAAVGIRENTGVLSGAVSQHSTQLQHNVIAVQAQESELTKITAALYGLLGNSRPTPSGQSGEPQSPTPTSAP